MTAHLDQPRPRRRQVWAWLFSALLFAPALQAAAATVPAAPTNFYVGSVSKTVANLYWDANPDRETQFWIQQKTLNGTFQDRGTTFGTAALISGLAEDTIYVFRIRAHNAAGDSVYSKEVFASTSSEPRPCVTTFQSMCLQDGRFELKSYWRVGQGPYVPGSAVQMTSDTGYFWFFNSANVEMVVKVLRGCAVNGYFWVYAGGLTDVEVIWTVNDTRAGFITTYVNPAGIPFAPVQATSDQGGCP